MKKSFLAILFLCASLIVRSQVQPQFTHYSVDDGLSENNVVSILQDKKGFMWFGNYNGLNKFDGYTFRNFKGRVDQKFRLINYRVDQIVEDKHGYLWVQTYDGRIYRFDPSTENFLGVPQCVDEFKNYKSPLKEIYVSPDGTIWLWSKDGQNEDCFRVSNDINSDNVSVERYSKSNGDLVSNKINKVYQDKSHNTWILQDKGIVLLKARSSVLSHPFRNNAGYGIYSSLESSGKIFFGGEQGKVIIYNEKKGTFEQVRAPVLSNIIDIKKLDSGELFFLYDENKFSIFNIDKKEFTVTSIDGLKENKVLGAYKDAHSNIWIDSKYQGAIVYKYKTKKLEYLPVDPIEVYANYLIPVFRVLEDKHDNLWLVTKNGGFYYYNSYNNKLEPFHNDPTSKDRKFSNLIHTAFLDGEGNLWLSTFSQGIDKISIPHSQFKFIRPFDLPVYSIKNEIRAIYKDSRSWTWVASRKGNVYLYDEKMKYQGFLGSDGKLNSSNPIQIPVYSITEDRSGVIWLGSKGLGVFKVIRTTTSIFKIENYQYNPDDIFSLASNAVYSIYQDHQNRIWIATYGGGINLLDNSSGTIKFISSRNNLKNYPIDECNKARYITEDRSGNILVGTTGGLVIFKPNYKSLEETRFLRYGHNPNKQSFLSGNDVQYILNTKKGDLYLALFGGGLNVLRGGFGRNQSPKFEVYEKTNGVFSNVILTLKEDLSGCVWMTTQTKIVKYDPSSGKFNNYKPINTNDYYFVEGAACVTKEGEIVYGTSDGLLTFNPLKIRKSNYIPRISFTELQVFNKPVVIGTEGVELAKTIDDSKKIVLSHKQNVFSIEFAALDYINPQSVQYAYKLEGFENNWNYVGTQHIATYTNLPRGKYIFHVKSTNADGEWVENERTIVIIKEPSFWESVWGWLFYFVLLVLLVVIISYVLFTIYRLRNEVDVEHRITNIKLRFFTDVSHELRTPLTLMISPIEGLLKREISLSENGKDQLLLMQRNGERLMRLINQILDFRKIQSNKLNLILEKVDVAEYIHEICENFKNLAEEKNISLNVLDEVDDANLWIDKDKFEKILYNLLSNAFKFSQSKKTVEIIITGDTDNTYIEIIDQGIGISIDRIKLLFERFESFASNSTVALQASTGIGLSLTKELIELHHATIEVESEAGKGTVFKLCFQKGLNHFNETDNFVVKEKAEYDNSVLWSDNDEAEVESEEKQNEPDMNKILVVEDNIELRQFLKLTLADTYEVLEAENGVLALELALKFLPDVIVSDIMMPDMDGIELTKRIKSDLRLSHIPLILLTAKTDLDSKLEAMELGADDYITKPFSSTFLEARIENLLKQRKMLQQFYQTSLSGGVISISKPKITRNDEHFMNKVMEFIEGNYANSNLNIDDLAKSSNLSRSTFFKKIKTITGFAPVDFVREFRLQRAMQILTDGDTNISEIAYLVGIEDPRYFSKCFKQKYGMNPSEYKQKREDN